MTDGKYKIVYNGCFGGFSLSSEAVRLAKKLSPECPNWQEVDEKYGYLNDIARHDKTLVSVVETLGNAASGSCADLRIEIIPTPMYRIDEYDGFESVQTPNDIDWVVIQNEDTKL
jgi:hypothetical protein